METAEWTPKVRVSKKGIFKDPERSQCGITRICEDGEVIKSERWGMNHVGLYRSL